MTPSARGTPTRPTLKDRTRRLAREKSYLQLIIHLMNRLGGQDELEECMATVITGMVENIGGTDAHLYVFTEDGIRLARLDGSRRQVSAINDDLVLEAVELRKPFAVAADFTSTKLTSTPFEKAWTWVVPLAVGAEVIGVLKLIDTHVSLDEMSYVMPTLFAYIAMTLKNAVRGHARLQEAYSSLRLSNEALTHENEARRDAEKRLRETNDRLEQQVLERTRQLLESRENLSLLLNSTQEGIYGTDLAGKITFCNAAAQRILGLAPDADLAGRPAHDLLHLGVPAQPAECPICGVIRHGNTASGEITLTRSDGSRFPAEYRVDPVIADSAVLGSVVSFADITDRRRAEDTLYEAQQVYRALIENSPDIIARYDRDCRRTYVNPSYTREAEAPPPQWIASAPLQVSPLPPASAAVLQGLLRRVLDSAIPEDTDVVWPKADGIDHWFNVFAFPELDRDGHVVSVMTVSRDITPRKLAEATLQRRNRELRAISNCNQTLMRAVDEQSLLNEICRIVCDEAGYRMAWVGYAEHNEAGTIRPVAWAGADSGHLEKANLNGEPTEGRGPDPAGTAIRTASIVCIQDFSDEPQAASWRTDAMLNGYRSGIALPLKNEIGTAFGALLIYSTEVNAFTPDEIRLLEELAGDLAFGIIALRTREERRAAENRLHDSVNALSRMNAELERFAHITSHDLQEPVRTVVSFSQMLQRHLGGGLDATATEYLGFIVNGARRMGDLVHDLLSYTRMSNRQAAHLAVDLDAVVADARDNLRSLIDEREVEFDLGALPRITGDRILLIELFQNLIGNAIKFTPYDRRPQVTISARPDGDMWHLTVADQGIGIAPAYHQRIFEIFQRLHAGTAYPGTGIGLSVCKGIVEQHGGRIWVESEEGRGATFHFTLPPAPDKPLAVSEGRS